MVLADTLELLHILSVFFLLAALGMATYSSVMMARTDDIQKFALYFAIGSTGGMIAAITTILTGVFGVLAAWEIGWPLTSGWLIAAYISIGFAFAIPVAVFKPASDKVEALMPRALEEGRVLPEQRAIFEAPLYRGFELGMYALLVFIAYVMVFKPF